MSTLDLYKQAVKKHNDYNLNKYETNKAKTIKAVEQALSEYDGVKDEIRIDVTVSSGFSLEVVTDVTSELIKQGINAKWTKDTYDTTEYFIIIRFYKN